MNETEQKALALLNEVRGAWCEWKSITSARAIEIVRNLTNIKRPDNERI